MTVVESGQLIEENAANASKPEVGVRCCRIIERISRAGKLEGPLFVHSPGSGSFGLLD